MVSNRPNWHRVLFPGRSARPRPLELSRHGVQTMTNLGKRLALVLPVILGFSAIPVRAQQSGPATATPQQADVRQQLENLERQVGELQKQVELLKQQLQPDSTAKPAPAASTAAVQPGDEHQHKVDEATKKKEPVGGVFPKSWKVPGTDVYLGIGGYVKFDFIQDFGPVGNVDQFKVNSIANDGSTSDQLGGRTTLNARETRFNFDLHSQSSHGKLRAFVEVDFYGDNNVLRLRHAFGEFGNLLAGQTWSTFMDVSARPLTLDFEGPDGEVFIRQPQIRWTQPIGEHWKVAIAAENPSNQLTNPFGVSGSPNSLMPDIPVSVWYGGSRGHVQVAGIARQVRFARVDAFDDSAKAGLGLNSTFVLNTVGKDTLSGQFAFGDGIGRYIESFGGLSLDGFLRSDGTVELLSSRAGLLGYTRYWTPALRSGIGYSFADLERNFLLGGATLRRTQDARANLVWSPVPLVDIGGELLWGRRDNIDGSHGDAVRFQFSVKYGFN